MPQGLSEDDYLCGGVSSLRNHLIAIAFFRLNIVERFGTGIRRIRAAYQTSGVQSLFEVHSNSIAVTLPNVTAIPAPTDAEAQVLARLGQYISYSYNACFAIGPSYMP